MARSSAALSVDDILSHLKAAQLDETHRVQVRGILNISDLVCFAGTSRDAGQMREDLHQTRDLIAYLEKYL